MNYESSWTQPGEGFLKEVVTLTWKKTSSGVTTRFETTYKGQVITLEQGGTRGEEIQIFAKNFKTTNRAGNYDSSTQEKESKAAMNAALLVAAAVARYFEGKRKIFVHSKLFSSKVQGFPASKHNEFHIFKPTEFKKNIWKMKDSKGQL